MFFHLCILCLLLKNKEIIIQNKVKHKKKCNLSVDGFMLAKKNYANWIVQGVRKQQHINKNSMA